VSRCQMFEWQNHTSVAELRRVLDEDYNKRHTQQANKAKRRYVEELEKYEDPRDSTPCSAQHIHDRAQEKAPSKSDLTWIKCRICKLWFHDACYCRMRDIEMETWDKRRKFECAGCVEEDPDEGAAGGKEAGGGHGGEEEEKKEEEKKEEEKKEEENPSPSTPSPSTPSPSPSPLPPHPPLSSPSPPSPLEETQTLRSGRKRALHEDNSYAY
jgi:hypothetical protein